MVSNNHHILHYFVLALGLGTVFMLLYIFKFQPQFQVLITVLGAVFLFCLGNSSPLY